jgi:hypothetical protein
MTEAEQFCNDLDLMKLAAKAAGMHSSSTYYGSLLMPWGKDQPKGKNFLQNGCQEGWAWNPLIDDGDAFRLAVKLNMQIWRNTGGTVSAMPPNGIGFWDRLHDALEPDPYAATRRAIVRAAANLAEKGATP